MKQDLIIAIDGHSSTGKSSLSKIIAKKLGYTHIDSGAMYRAVTLFALNNGLIENQKVKVDQLVARLPEIQISFKLNSLTNKNETFLNGQNVEAQIRDLKVSSMVSPIAVIAEVREYCVALQQKMGKAKRIVMDGRDIGTTVYPNADIKFFITASAEIRAKRRFLEYQQEGKVIPLDEVLANVIERDHIDSSREHSPLRKAHDAIEVDNSNLNLEETVEHVMQILQKRFN
ncbi:(d)CMP kinase [Faecalibacter rhinopitheci]|uniref:Cytidylate kinase n=1 Tax=Faecalibacter rhinopitheci TaxID=2779678 RepID=A0A8J7G9E7_9FLAO|nr:(d)CMP kinase [Faecalibacter rhinopitheci]MBF0597890.1 (d)CMP kinase [Faecalibacter rhinopitheci]MBQ0148077.1 (d)CMP kinase [Candidatus Onthonaster equi]